MSHQSTAWAHDPPCPKGGHTAVSPHVMRNECCPLCGVPLTPPPAVAEARRVRAKADERAAAAWLGSRPTPEEIVEMGRTDKTLDEIRRDT